MSFFNLKKKKKTFSEIPETKLPPRMDMSEEGLAFLINRTLFRVTGILVSQPTCFVTV